MNAKQTKLIDALKIPTREVRTAYFTDAKEVSKDEKREYPVSGKIESMIENALADSLVSSFSRFREELKEKGEEILSALSDHPDYDAELPETVFFTSPREDFDIVKEAEKLAASTVRSWAQELAITAVAKDTGLNPAPAVEEAKTTSSKSGLDLGIDF